MAQTAAQKALSRAAGRPVTPGELVEAWVDRVMIHDNVGALVLSQFRRFPGGRVWDPDRVHLVFDHHSPSSTHRAAGYHRLLRQFAQEQGIPWVFDVGEGISHHALTEAGRILPGQVVVGTDSHSTAMGALGAFATGMGATEVAAVLNRGRLWFRVPESVAFELHGALPRGVDQRDLVLKIIGDVGPYGLNYQCAEFAGPAVAGLSIKQRLAISAMSLEMGAKAAMFPADDVALAYLSERGTAAAPLDADPGAAYAGSRRYDLTVLAPQVCLPHLPTNARDVGEVEPVPINQGVVGSCAGATIHDLRAAAAVLRGRRVQRGVRLLITPCSRPTWLQALREGLFEIFTAAGAVVESPGCGACGGYEAGCLAPGEVCISTTTRNFYGRMGSEASIYLAAAATVAASAVVGHIADPRPLLAEGVEA